MRLSLAVFLSLVTACGSATPIRCGIGTRLERDVCVVDQADASFVADAASIGDASVVIADLGNPVVTGDSCASGKDACWNRRVFACNRVPGPKQWTLSDQEDCRLLDGDCVLDAAGNASCGGGHYTPCDKQADAPYCFSGSVLAVCNLRWAPTDCATSGPPSAPPWICAAGKCVAP